MPLGSITKTEVPHNTREQAVDVLRAAIALVDELEPPDDLRAAVFAQAAQLLAAKQVFYEQTPMGVADLGALRHQ